MAALAADEKPIRYVSPRFDYEWRLPAGWERVEGVVDLGDAPAGYETVAARPRGGGSRDSVIIAVTDTLTTHPGALREGAELVGLEDYAKKWFLFHGVSESDVAQVKFMGGDAVRFSGQIQTPGTRLVSVTLFTKDRRWFEVRCVSEAEDSNVACADLDRALVIADSRLDAPEQGRTLRVHDPKSGISFAAPADGWMAHDPRVEHDGRQMTWIWTRESRRIELFAAPIPATWSFAATTDAMAERFRKQGATVVRTDAVLAGQPAVRLQIDKEPARHDDLFVQRRGAVVYGVGIGGPARDADLVERVRGAVEVDVPAAPPPP
jgi:hypothetical protein